MKWMIVLLIVLVIIQRLTLVSKNSEDNELYYEFTGEIGDPKRPAFFKLKGDCDDDCYSCPYYGSEFEGDDLYYDDFEELYEEDW